MIRTKFDVLGKIDNNVNFDELILTSHWSKERLDRHNNIINVIGNGDLIESFEVDTGHRNGNEIHNIFTNGIILIQNKESKKIVTELIARPQQLKRYWEYIDEELPYMLNETIDLARRHQLNGFNNW